MAVQLNLARKWRSKQFDQVVGQELSVRMLQNSLYLDQIFPVYLFSGQRGCGKTTTARIFAAALNCQQLPDFRKDPKNKKIPCLECQSCQAMAANSHPDFIEIDAASHTGVDNVRQIIDAASLMPVMGRKRLYLIDEAHMLSKAAFNAFLKILEEPPESVVFMLATTDPEKIIETVRSRCFQLFFPALEQEALLQHLKHVCQAEEIAAEDKALSLIIKEAEGSARDALNIVEQVRFSHAAVSKEAVLRVLGHFPEELLLELLEYIHAGNEQALIAFFDRVSFEHYTIIAVWNALQEIIRALLFIKYGVQPKGEYDYGDRIQKIARSCSRDHLLFWLQCLYDHEMLLLKSTAQQGVLQTMLIKMCCFAAGLYAANTHVEPIYKKKNNSADLEQKKVTQEESPISDLEQKAQATHQEWNAFLKDVQGLSDPLIVSLFKQVLFMGYTVDTHKVALTFTQDTPFFKEWVQESQAVWLPLLQKHFGQKASVVIAFKKTASASLKKENLEEQKTKVVEQKKVIAPQKKAYSGTFSRAHTPEVTTQVRGKKIDVSDKEKWKFANQLLDTFGGTVIEVEGEQ